ncbi:MAG: tRNA (guanosine(37)-N1)-methyltransferase TrmD [Pseudomonadales bacterium]|nr:tRNA (guanosine(37)-N1)-methyltransferase TrmD [Pseudomonadales bacterium]
MKFSVVTLFPQMFDAITAYGVTSRAVKRGLLEVSMVNPRDFTEDKHRTVDDRSYGGGPGMVMMVEPMKKAIHQAKTQLTDSNKELTEVAASFKVIYLSPQGAALTQAKAKELAQLSAVVLIAGRYEGLDQRLIDAVVDEEISIGDFVVSGGELPAMVLIDAVARCLPDVLGHNLSAEEDSFSAGLLDHPHYTRPVQHDDGSVPDVLLSGNHEHIRVWRLKQSLGQTWLKRPDLLKEKTLTDEEQRLLAEFQMEWQSN